MQAIAAGLIGHETATGQNILNWWGGAVEVATYSAQSRQFQKVSNVLHTIWIARLNNQDERVEISLAPRFIKYDYFDDALVAQTYELVFKETNGAPARASTERSYHIYTPLLDAKTEYDWAKIKLFDLKHTMLCCYLLFDGTIGNETLIHIDYSHSGDTPLRIVDNGGEQISLSFRDDLLRSLEAQVTASTGRPAQVCRLGF